MKKTVAFEECHPTSSKRTGDKLQGAKNLYSQPLNAVYPVFFPPYCVHCDHFFGGIYVEKVLCGPNSAWSPSSKKCCSHFFDTQQGGEALNRASPPLYRSCAAHSPLQLLHPQPHHGVGGHTPVPPGAESCVAYFWSVGQAGALELLREEAAVEGPEPFEDDLPAVDPVKGQLRQTQHLLRPEAPAENIVQEEVVELIGPHQVLRPLADLTLDRRKELRRDRRVQDILQHVGQILVLL